MRTIGIVGAMEAETAPIKAMMEVISTKQIAGMEFLVGKMSGKSVVLAACRVGKVNAAICTQILIDLYGVDMVIGLGVAGCIDKSLDIGDVVVSGEVFHHDYDTTAFGIAPGVNKSLPDSFFKGDPDLVALALEASGQVLTTHQAMVGRIATGDQFIADNEAKLRIWQLFKAQCVEMEGAAMGQVCMLNQVPFVIVRAMSDKADQKSPGDFERMLKTATANAAAVVGAMLERL